MFLKHLKVYEKTQTSIIKFILININVCGIYKYLKYHFVYFNNFFLFISRPFESLRQQEKGKNICLHYKGNDLVLV